MTELEKAEQLSEIKREKRFNFLRFVDLLCYLFFVTFLLFIEITCVLRIFSLDNIKYSNSVLVYLILVIVLGAFSILWMGGRALSEKNTKAKKTNMLFLYALCFLVGLMLLFFPLKEIGVL